MAPEAERGEISWFFRIPLEHIGYVRAVVEAYDGLGTIFAQDPARGEIEFVAPADRRAEVESLVDTLARETGWVEIARPPDWNPA
jgi:hypothetical protein